MEPSHAPFFSSIRWWGQENDQGRTEAYEGFTIRPEPADDDARFRVGAQIWKEVEGEIKTHVMIHADELEVIDSANEVSTSKLRQMIGGSDRLHRARFLKTHGRDTRSFGRRGDRLGFG